MVDYAFQRTNGQWFLLSRNHTHLEPHVSDFLKFYSHFTADSLFQMESLAENLSITIPSDEEMDDEEAGNLNGTISRDQWPVFRPEMPSGEFVNISFGQSYPNPHRLHLLQCGISNGMLDVFTFQKEDEHWKLVSYEN